MAEMQPERGGAHDQRHQFEALYVRWSRLQALIDADAVSLEARGHLLRTRDVLACRMGEIDPGWSGPVVRWAA